ncbi:shikimate kinase [Horticoccus luteus]|uniref:Shikimate kinase n=1 Tax=Horticoccus luteus TaxID=2862869 RepID=A0A8F9TXH7_9BACT|nr:shikimate kinase [Horticoccus luteus]QYM79940.1 shikimate kinase [Horticoccus luteus]
MNAADVNLYLVGFMGTGKTTIGRAVAARVGFQFIDSDHQIEREQAKTIPEIFAEKGEAAFRAMERAFVVEGHPGTRAVVACGGGLVVQPGNLSELQARGVVICLHASVESILARTSRFRHRPLLEVEDPAARIRELYAVRAPIYRRAGSMILTDARPLGDIVNHVLRAWRHEAKDWVRQRSAT